MDDLISRSEVLDLIKKSFLPEEYGVRLLYQSVAQLLPSNPEIIRCKDCKNRETVILDVMPEIEVHVCDHMKSMIRDADYCSKAERKEDG